ncbi:MAG: alpha/beta hydrolase [Spirochaetes bacterium]|jgi:predicted alpha/beta superfamily hydrolase|nr:alpha/beta hydrolase [Spirochaetota bacterium]
MSREWSSRRNSKAACAAAALLAFILSATPDADADITGKKLVSRHTRHTYRVYIHLPDGYNESDRRHDVLYLLDGDKYFGDVVKAVQERPDGAPEKDLIIVGIGYGKGANHRKRDYTPIRVPGFPTGGGVKKFYRFLRTELAPRIDRKYRTNAGPAGRLIAGHSLGGIAVCYGLMYYHDFFGRFIAVSPSLWWGDGMFINRYRMDFSGIPAGEPLYYYSASGTLEDSSMDDLARMFDRRVRRKAGERAIVRYSLFEGLGHDDLFVPAIAEGLEAIYAPVPVEISDQVPSR